mgnify:CR=1 FL=1
MALRFVDLTQTKQWLTDQQRVEVRGVIASSFSNVLPADYMAKYFDHPQAFQRKLRLYYHGERLAGYCLLVFTDESGAVLIRASAGFIPEYRQGSNTFQFSLAEGIKCWLRRPWRKLYYADTMLSPAMYRAIAKNLAIIWPHPSHKTPNALFERFNPNGSVSQTMATRCLVSVGRVSNYTESDLAAFQASDKPEIRFYQNVNPDFTKGVALFVIAPVHLKQLILTGVKRFRRG